MPRIARSRSAVAVALVAGALVAVPSAPAATLPEALTQSSPQFAVRPAQISYTGDSSGILGGPRTSGARFGRITWTSWTTSAAEGRGLVWLNDCRPNCAASPLRSHRVRISLSSPAGGHFRRLTIRFRSHGRTATDVRRVEGRGGSAHYALVRQSGL